MFLSLIIPVYNVEKYIEHCIQSCLKQDLLHDDYEIIIVNDGTRDNSMDIVSRYENEFPNLIKSYSQENRGLSAARNLGLSKAKGEYIWFIDSDDWITSNCLKKIKDKINLEKPDILAICYTNLIGETLVRRNSYNNECSKDGKTCFNQIIMPCAPFGIYKRKFLLNNNLVFKEGIFHEDAELIPRVYYKASKVSFLNDTLYNVFPNPSSITRSVNPKKAFDLIIVCNSLDDFSKEISDDCKTHLSFLISMNLNNALFLSYKMQIDDINRLNNIILKNKHLFNHLKKSKVIKYQIEYFLFKIFSSKTVQIYKFLQLLNK